ncbi:hypothetical protein ACVWY2_004459 [Bradyrhizobium sp. JR6.1]
MGREACSRWPTLLFDVTSVPFPANGCEQATLDALESACRKEIPAAFFVEPLWSGAGGIQKQPYFAELVFKPASIPCLQLEEARAEKIRATLQRAKIPDLRDLQQSPKQKI